MRGQYWSPVQIVGKHLHARKCSKKHSRRCSCAFSASQQRSLIYDLYIHSAKLGFKVSMSGNEVICLWFPSLGWTFGLDWELLILQRACTKANLPFLVNASALMRFDSRGHAVHMVIKIHGKLLLSSQSELDGLFDSKIPWLRIHFLVPGFVPLHRDFLVQKGREAPRHFFFIGAHMDMFCLTSL